MADKKEIVRLYRHVLKLARQYPSIKRDAIIEDIKLEFHESKHITDPQLIQRKVASARQGIVELSMYANMSGSSTSWSVDVGREVAKNGGAAPAKPSSSSSSSPYAGVKIVGDKKK